MNKAIKVTEENAAAIEAALKAVNGRAEAHAYSTIGELLVLAKIGEIRLEDLALPKAKRVGAVLISISGDAVNNTYAKAAFSRPATRVRLERRATGWFLCQVSSTPIGRHGGGPSNLVLTKAQADEAVRRFSQQFSVSA